MARTKKRRRATSGACKQERCPYCDAVQDPPPTRRRKCRDCKQTIYILREGKHRRLITEQEHKRLERERRELEWKALSLQVRESLEAGDWVSASHAYASQVGILYAEGRNYRHLQEEAYRCRLMGLSAAGIKKVEVSTSADERVCAGCAALDGKTFTVALALERALLPACRDDHDEPCRCVYQVVIGRFGN